MKTGFFLTIFLALTALSTTAPAEENLNLATNGSAVASDNAVTCRIGGYVAENSKDFGGNGIEFALRHKPVPFVAAEIALGYYNGHNGGFIDSGDNFEVVPLTATAKGVLPFEIGNLYVGAGVGVYRVFPKGRSSFISEGYNLGTGAEINITKTEFWILDYKKIIIGKEKSLNISGSMFTLGFGYRF